MIVLYPFSAESNTEDFLNFESEQVTMVPVVRLMESSVHSQFNRFFKEYKVRDLLVKNDYRERMVAGDFFYVPTDFGYIVCIGMSHKMSKDDVASALKTFVSVVGKDQVVLFEGFKDWVPGAEHLTSPVKEMDAAVVCHDWEGFVSHIQNAKEVESTDAV